jgi:hypothetical protein
VEFVDEARSFLKAAGYQPGLLSRDYRFTWRVAQGDLVNGVLPLVAFGAPPFTLRTACVSVLTADSDVDLKNQMERLAVSCIPSRNRQDERCGGPMGAPP